MNNMGKSASPRTLQSSSFQALNTSTNTAPPPKQDPAENAFIQRALALSHRIRWNDPFRFGPPPRSCSPGPL
ncbi:hypothetical protein Moror_8871 [Moniliophthora roreri MCA 2997]|uniref:Uncharacterized protein n=1 Tax=Moniliophthora roreri (strain MCA 2997) TaxID=1381753 RepID=V2XJQ6_MONRO|nr:hypothetical protein Moror_8871 [Moniliophthora roreri MCA 2997]